MVGIMIIDFGQVRFEMPIQYPNKDKWLDCEIAVKGIVLD